MSDQDDLNLPKKLAQADPVRDPHPNLRVIQGGKTTPLVTPGNVPKPASASPWTLD
jgi:hypothetical protein